jgi:hypothetical protein
MSQLPAVAASPDARYAAPLCHADIAAGRLVLRKRGPRGAVLAM